MSGGGTFVDFVPSPTTPFQFQPTLNGVQYLVTVPSNLFGLRYYIDVTDLSGNPVLYRALAESGPTIKASFTWQDNVGTAVAQAPHNVPIGSQCNVRVTQTDTAFDDTYLALAIDPFTLTFPLTSNPNQSIPVTGALNFDLDLLGGLGIGSLFFHSSTQQFEY